MVALDAGSLHVVSLLARRQGGAQLPAGEKPAPGFHLAGNPEVLRFSYLSFASVTVNTRRVMSLATSPPGPV